MKILLDMNIPPLWVKYLQKEGWEVVHWAQIGDIRAPDIEIMAWAKQNGYIVFTHDLDFGAILAATHADGPSVVQIRVQDIFPQKLARRLIPVLRMHEALLGEGVLMVIDEQKSRIRILPFR
jgi:predicted nuclease of predicted toxin-antitoxin system